MGFFAGDGNPHDPTGEVFDAQIMAVNQGTDGNFYYQWQEQAFSPGTGMFTPLSSGRFGWFNPTGPSGFNPAFEMNNRQVAVGTFVQMRLRGIWAGNYGGLYEFEAPGVVPPSPSGGTPNVVPSFSGPSALQNTPFEITTFTNTFGSPQTNYTFLWQVGSNPATTPFFVFQVTNNSDGSNTPFTVLQLNPAGSATPTPHGQRA